jgi:hypothetical protein
MLEDFRDHDPNPTVHERAWMETNPYPAAMRVVVLAMVAMMIGLAVTREPSPETPSPVSAAARTTG